MLIQIKVPNRHKQGSYVFSSKWTVADAAEWAASKFGMEPNETFTFRRRDGSLADRTKTLGDEMRGCGDVELVWGLTHVTPRLVIGATKEANL